MEIISVSGAKDLTEKLNSFSDCLVVLFFYVDDSAECNQMNDIITELISTSEDKAAFIKINALKDEETFGANAPVFSKKFEEYLYPEKNLNGRLLKLINKAHVMLFMKGSPGAPRCGFSKQVTALLSKHNAKYETFDILEDYEVREALKTYSNWPTYPQLYIKGKLIGGLDILKALSDSGELDDLLASEEK
ncbi:glutaredoxin-3 [Caerostris extrusa]|uniref:Glutaredoxin-3 n=1 Tax=Caerostris extrusa TaxID=172846 RepID=A0AAV4Q9L7_CAEEX|nr:glutaredoxin-3 [Caerostris extrusa]